MHGDALNHRPNKARLLYQSCYYRFEQVLIPWLMAREEIVVEAVPVTPGTSRHSSWAKWIRKIYETDPLTCSECGEPMRIIAFITDPLEVAKILEHIGEQTSRAPPLMPTDPVPSFCDFGDTNFQYPEVPWYPDPPVFDH